MSIPEMQEELNALETKIRRLKQEYEQYFMRILKREPLLLRKEIEGKILRYTNMTINNTGDQFKLSCLMSRFNSYRQYWARTLRAIEDGVYGRRAESGSIAPPCLETAAAGHGAAARDSLLKELAGGQENGTGQGACEDLTPLYNEYIEARKRNNVSVKGITREKFLASIKGARDRIARNYDVSDTDVSLIEKNGAVKLVIKPAGVKVK